MLEAILLTDYRALSNADRTLAIECQTPASQIAHAGEDITEGMFLQSQND